MLGKTRWHHQSWILEMKKVFDIHLHAELNIVGKIMTSRIEHRTITFDIRLELAKILVCCYRTYSLLFGHHKAQKIYSTIASCIFIHLISIQHISEYRCYSDSLSIHKFPCIIAPQGLTETVGRHYHLAPGALSSHVHGRKAEVASCWSQ